MFHIGPNFPCSLGGIVSKLADFLRHNGKPSPCVACSCRLNGSIQRQQIGLLGNLGNRTYKGIYDSRLLTQRVYAIAHLSGNGCGFPCPVSQQMYDFHAVINHFFRFVHQLFNFFHHPADFLDFA